MVVDCVYWTSSATAISTRADDTHLIEYPADMRTLMRRISALLGVWDRLLPISLMACKESTLDADPAFDSLEHNSRIVEFLELYPNAAVTDTRDFKRVDDVSFTGDLTMGLGRAMAQVVNGTSVAVALEG